MTNTAPRDTEAAIRYILDEGIEAICANDNARHANVVEAYARFCGVDRAEATERILGAFDAMTGGSRFDGGW